jgi:hypothetical protein
MIKEFLTKLFNYSVSTEELILRFFTAVKFQVDVFCVVTACSVVVGYQRFRDHPEDGGGMDF